MAIGDDQLDIDDASFIAGVEYAVDGGMGQI